MPHVAGSSRESFFALMGHTSRQWRRVLDRRLLPLGLTQATWLALLHLSRAPEPLRQKDLAQSMGLDGSSVVRLLDALQSDGLVERLEHADRRAKTLRLTPEGCDMVARVEAIAQDLRARLLNIVDSRELDAAFAVLLKVSDALDQDPEQWV
ncbi:MarR family transcriptional regulator [Castellaniella sp. GW247-6E4]|uniref:MarR family winged helix-turn-helix transcriptional regulator n=1 Tax=Castellaniella sp. GW247-6E4 TaxID=3140380 RepID=UPI003315C1C9